MATPENTLPLDTNVHVPESVRRAAAAADAIHAQAYTQPEPPQQPQPEPPQQPQPEPPQQQQQAEPPQQHQPEPPPPMSDADKNVSADEWRHRFLSMQGRFNAATRQIGAMEQQMTELGQELVRTQNLLAGMSQPQPQPQIDRTHGNLITEADREGYGEELIDLARRAAMDVVGPEIEQLRAQNARLTERVQSTGKRELFLQLDRAVPQWRQINKAPQFLAWLRLPNVYTGALRGEMLKEAVAGAEAPKAIALFREFIAEATATGAMAPAQQDEPAPTVPPREPAVPLEHLAAPGRPRPAVGDAHVPSEKPIYTRAQISKFYDEKRKGLWVGREAEAHAFEADLIAAQGQGRIR